MEATSYRWLAALSTFSFKFQYRASRQNVDADSLSRGPQEPIAETAWSSKVQERIHQYVQHHLQDSVNTVSATNYIVHVICEKHLIKQFLDPEPDVAEVGSLALHPDAVPEDYGQKGKF